MSLFDRKYELKIHPLESFTAQKEITITDLRIEFEVSRGFNKAQTAKIKIYNPNPSLFDSIQNRHAPVSLSVGYGEDIGIIFNGTLSIAYAYRNNTDTFVEMYCVEKGHLFSNVMINKSYKKGTTILDIVKDIVSNQNIGLSAEVKHSIGKKKTLSSVSFSAPFKEVMEELRKDYDFNWCISGNRLIIHPSDINSKEMASLATEYRVVSSNTGLLGTPSVTYNGCDIVHLLDYRMMPLSFFKIDTSSVNVSIGNLFFPATSQGFTSLDKFYDNTMYQIRNSTFKGDSKQGSWSVLVSSMFVGDSAGI